ncbi:short-chain dehydrogenase [Pseudoalteromonas issachenkonii]|uniref:Short-chain dehydrogenase n=1 Tax=Pseudoalteromonas issachenkonii TaxID=152297 RepID=A0ABU9H121_9GAMM
MKKILVSLSLLAMSFSSLAEDINEGQLQSYIKALPAVTSWASSQESLKDLDLASMLGGSADQSVGEQSSLANSALSMIKEQDLYKSFASVTNRYGFTPEQLVTVGSEVSMAYIENLKSGLSADNQETANKVMSGFQSMKSAKDKGASSLMGSFGKSSSAAEESTESLVSENNLELVNEYMPQLQKLFALL